MKFSKSQTLFIALFGCFFFVASSQAGSIVKDRLIGLKTAKQLAQTRYSGWTYGSKTSAKKIDCSQFMLAVVEDLNGEKLSPNTKSLLVISGVGSQANLNKLITTRDKRSKGVVAALADLGLAIEIDPSEAQPGDFVQYWYRSKGAWAGHTAIVETAEKNKNGVDCKLFGSHKSMNGIATSKYKVNLTKSTTVAFVARLKS